MGHLGAHAQCVGVLEPERAGHLHPPRPKGGAQLLLSRPGGAPQDLAGDGPGVLRIGVELAAGERLPEHPRPAQGPPVQGRDALRGQQLARQLGQHLGLHELLRAHPDRLRRLAGGQQREEQRRPHGAPSAPRWSARWAPTKRATKGSAGVRTSSSSDPIWAICPSRRSAKASPK